MAYIVKIRTSLKLYIKIFSVTRLMEESSKNTNIKSFDSQKLPIRIGLGLMILLAILFGWFMVRWQLGNMLAELTLPTEPNARQVAEAAIDLSPNDPLAKWLKTNTQEDVFTPESAERAVYNNKEVIRSSPYNFAWWVELGRAYEQAEQLENAEKAFLRAIELAPAYTYPHWQMGNFYLRTGSDEKAFAELQKAAETNAVYREQVFSIAWDFYEQDTERLEKIAGDTPDVRAGLAKFYAAKERAKESLKMWNSLSSEEKKSNQEVAKLIAQALYDKQFYGEAVEFVRDLKIEPDAGKEKIQNGGFEKRIEPLDKTYFNWKIQKTENIEIKIDPTQKHEGRKSLRVVFSGYDKPELYNIFQVVAVEPSVKYNLSFWLKSKDLKSSGKPILEIVDARTNKIIAVSESFPTDAEEWQQIKVNFTTPEDTDAVTIRTSRVFCGDVCPIVGIFWYDNFELNKL